MRTLKTLLGIWEAKKRRVKQPNELQIYGSFTIADWEDPGFLASRHQIAAGWENASRTSDLG